MQLIYNLQAIVYIHGGRVGFSRCDVKLLADDIKTLAPTIIPTVPRLLNRIYDRIMAEAGTSRLKKFLINFAVKMKEKEMNQCVLFLV